MQRHPDSVFGRRLRAAREAAGLPQDRLGTKIGIDEGCGSARIGRYETGIHQPAFEIAEKIATVLRVPTAYFYCRSDALSEVLCATSDFTHDELNRLKKSADRIGRSRE
jgi:transcriptional regulator with XRE-family HTH domain